MYSIIGTLKLSVGHDFFELTWEFDDKYFYFIFVVVTL
jgi:hypothetical protein